MFSNFFRRNNLPAHPRVGVAVFVFNDSNCFILGKRKGSHGAGTWGLPGGHLEFEEEFEECAAREIKEETDLDIEDIRFLTATNDIMKAENKHYITIFLAAKVKGPPNSQPKVMEENKCAGWDWVSWEQLTSDGKEQREKGEQTTGRKLFLPLLSLLEQRNGFSPLA